MPHSDAAPAIREARPRRTCRAAPLESPRLCLWPTHGRRRMTETTPSSDTTADRARVGASFIALALGVAAGALGILPWLVGGGTLPLQNLWANNDMPNDMPFALLPVSQYAATAIFVLL